MASALVYARTGDAAYGERARAQIMAAIGTEQEGATNSILSLGRQLGAYVLAADFIGLSGADDERFRAWLDAIRTRELGGHGRWTSLIGDPRGRAEQLGLVRRRIADRRQPVPRRHRRRRAAAQVLRGFLGDRSAWTGSSRSRARRAGRATRRTYTPINPPCTRGGIDLDGAIVRDIDRGGNRKWPPGRDGIGYTLESLQGADAPGRAADRQRLRRCLDAGPTRRSGARPAS